MLSCWQTKSLTFKPRLLIARRNKKQRGLHILNLQRCNDFFDCRVHNLSNLVTAATELPQTDVFVSVHGADMANAFAVKRGATVVEIMPVLGYSEITVTMFEPYFTEAKHVSVWSAQAQRRGRHQDYNRDLVIDWADIASAITSNATKFIAHSLHALGRRVHSLPAQYERSASGVKPGAARPAKANGSR